MLSAHSESVGSVGDHVDHFRNFLAIQDLSDLNEPCQTPCNNEDAQIEKLRRFILDKQ
jgi:hypothetical protein